MSEMDATYPMDGECFLTRLEDGRIRVDRADPLIRIATDLLPDLHESADGIVRVGDINPVVYKITARHERYVEAVRLFGMELLRNEAQS